MTQLELGFQKLALSHPVLSEEQLIYQYTQLVFSASVLPETARLTHSRIGSNNLMVEVSSHKDQVTVWLS